MNTVIFIFFAYFTFGQDTLIPQVTTPTVPVKVELEIIDMCDLSEEAMFSGGPMRMQQYIQNNLVYPACDDIEPNSKTYVTFVVELNGELTNIEVVGAHCPEMKRVLTILFEKMPPWLPGSTIHGKLARTRVMVPIQICLQ